MLNIIYAYIIMHVSKFDEQIASARFFDFSTLGMLVTDCFIRVFYLNDCSIRVYQSFSMTCKFN